MWQVFNLVAVNWLLVFPAAFLAWVCQRAFSKKLKELFRGKLLLASLALWVFSVTFFILMGKQGGAGGELGMSYFKLYSLMGVGSVVFFLYSFWLLLTKFMSAGIDEKTRPVSVMKFAAGALAAVISLNLVLRLALKLEGIPVTIGIAIGVAWLVAGWFAKSTGRAPMPQERSRFLWLYGGVLALLLLVVVFFASMQSVPNFAGCFILLLHYLPYPAFAQMVFSEKNFEKYFQKRT